MPPVSPYLQPRSAPGPSNQAQSARDPRGAEVFIPPGHFVGDLAGAVDRNAWIVATVTKPSVLLQSVVDEPDRETFLALFEESGEQLLSQVEVRVVRTRRSTRREVVAFEVLQGQLAEQYDSAFRVIYPNSPPAPPELGELVALTSAQPPKFKKIVIAGGERADAFHVRVRASARLTAGQLMYSTTTVLVEWASFQNTLAGVRSALQHADGVVLLPWVHPGLAEKLEAADAELLFELVAEGQDEPLTIEATIAATVQLCRRIVGAPLPDESAEAGVLRNLVRRLKVQNRIGTSVSGANHMALEDLCTQSVGKDRVGIARAAAEALERDGLLLVHRRKQEGVEVVLDAKRMREIDDVLRGRLTTVNVRRFAGLDDDAEGAPDL